MSCNQMPYQEGVHPKIRDWTTSTLQQAKKNPNPPVLKSKEEAAAVLLAPGFQTEEVALAAGTTTHGSLPEGGYADLQRAQQAQPDAVSDPRTDRPFLSAFRWRGVAVWMCWTSGPWKKMTFQLSTVVPGVWTAAGTQRSLLLPRQREDQRITPVCLRGSLAVPVQCALL